MLILPLFQDPKYANDRWEARIQEWAGEEAGKGSWVKVCWVPWERCEGGWGQGA